jgi:predicted peptidase
VKFGIFNGQETQKAVVSVILLDADGRILLQQRDDKPDLLYAGWWTIFGGYVEDGETPDDAIQREMREELDLDLHVSVWKTYDCPVRSKPGAVHTRNIVYVGRLDRPVQSLTLREGQGMQLFTPDEAVMLELAFGQHVMLRDYLKAQFGTQIRENLLLLEPHTIETGNVYPLVIFLHGSGERGDDLERMLGVSFPRFMTTGGDLPEPAFVLMPQCPTDWRWGYLLERLDALLDQVMEQNPIDPARVYLTGFSMGGFGAWQWASKRPDRFAALLSVGGSAFESRTGAYFNDLESIARNMPIWMVNAAADEIVPVTGSDALFAALLRFGATIGYTRYPDGGHGDVSNWAFWDKKHYQWLFRQRRKVQL